MADNSVRAFSDDSVDPAIRGFLHMSASANGDGLVLTHGAGGSAQSPLLVALAEKFSESGVFVLRCELPYRQRKSFGPPGPGDAARDRAGLANATRAIRKFAPYSIFLGGHSYGGRQASMLCAEQPDAAAALLLMSYPLHPPGKPLQLRTQHLTELRLPVFFISGMRDAFGTIEELDRARILIPAKTKLMPVEGGHDLGFKGKTKKETLPVQIRDEFLNFVAA